MKILVIGSNSFSGASFIDYALGKGCVVVGVSRSAQPNNIFLPYGSNPDKDERFSFYQFDLNKHLERIVELVRRERPEYIINYSAQGMVAESWLNPEHWMMTNVVSTTKLFNQLKDFDFIKKYVHFTTPEVYGSCDVSGWITEESVGFNPSTPYAVSRAAGDMSLKIYVENYGFPAVFTRAANIYGPRQQLYRIVPCTMLCGRLGQKLQLHGGGHSVRSFVYADDVSAATFQVAMRGEIGSTYHISTEQTVSIRELVGKICHLMGVDFDDLVCVTEDRLGKDQSYLLNSDRIRNDLGWFDSVDLDRGLRKTLAWVEANIDVIAGLPHDYVHKP